MIIPRIIFCQDYIDIRDKGASVHLEDNSAAIEKAIKEAALKGKPCYVPSGIYKITKQINLTGFEDKPLLIYGNRGTSIIKNNGNQHTLVFNKETEGYKLSKLSISGLKITGNSKNRSGLYLNGTINLMIKESEFSNHGSNGISLVDCNQSSLSNIEVIKNGINTMFTKHSSGLIIMDSYNVVISALKTISNVDGVVISNSKGVSFSGCSVKNNYRNGITLLGSRGCSFQGNFIKGNNEKVGTILESNTFEGYGVFVDKSIHQNHNNNDYFTSGVTFSGNFFFGGVNSKFAIYIIGGEYITIAGNHFQNYLNPSMKPIYISSLSNEILESNNKVCENCK